MNKKYLIAAVVLTWMSCSAQATMIIEYEEVGSDLVLEFSGSLNITNDNPSVTFDAPIAAMGNQIGGMQNSVFYSSPANNDWWGAHSGTASAPAFWGAGVVYDTLGNSAVGDTLMFRWNSSFTTPVIDVWLSPTYIAGNAISGALTLGGYSVASSGITDWSFNFNENGESIIIRAANAQVPNPATLALFGLGLAGLSWSRRKKA